MRVSTIFQFLCLALISSLIGITPQQLTAQTQVDFNFTGSAQTWQVPLGATSVTIETWGAQGNSNAGGVAGGQGGYATGELSVTGGETLYIYVGGGGSTTTSGGWNGGGTAGTVGCTGAFGGGGGGASDVRQGGTGLANRVIVGAGGGGAGGQRVNGCGRGTGGGGGAGWYGGGGGSAWPGPPEDYNNSFLATGGTQSAGGNGGVSTWESTISPVPNNDGYPGNFGIGGTGGDEIESSQSGNDTGPVGASGGGLTGSTANYSTGNNWTGMSGAGGSSYIGGVTSGSTSAGVRTGNGFVRITIPCINPLDPPTIDCSNLIPSVTRNTRAGFCDYVVQGTEFDPADYSCNVTSILVDYTATDNLNGAIFPVGTTPVTWTVSNSENETASCTFNVIVEDNEAPNAICKNITVQLNNIGGATIAASDINNNSNDACGIASLSASPTSFNCGAEGDNTVTLTVTDVNGNSSTCTSTVTVEDNVAPTASCQNVTVELDNNGDGTLSANDVDDNSFDACSIGSLSVSPNTFDCDDVGDNTVTLTVTDIYGNSSTCTATAAVEDNIAPVVVCQDVTVQLDPVTGTTPANPLVTGALVSRSDNCALASGLSANGPNPITCAQVGSYNQTIFIDDVNGNTTPCTVEITVQDITAPNAVCQNFTVQLDGSGNASITGSDIDGGSTDACGIGSLSASPNTFGCNNVGINSSTLTVMDNNGNTNTCLANVTVQDNVAPTAVCQDFTLNLDNPGTTTLDPADIDGGSSTVCGTYSLSVSPNGFDCDDLEGGPYTVTLTVTDDSNGQMDNCTANITVADPNSFCCDPPAAVCQNITVQLDASGNGSITASNVDGGSTADCGLQSLTATPTTFDCNDVGNNTVTLTITDIKNQSDNCTATVTVEDNVAPNAVCQNTTVQLDANGEGSIVAADIDGGSTDACGVASISASTTDFGCGDIGDNTITLTVTDVNNNSNTCTATVTVEDNVAPNAVCQNFTAQLDDNGEASIEALDIDGGSNDACGIASIAASPTEFDCEDVGGNTVTLTVTDNNGNSNTCTATVTVEDNVAPEITLCQGNSIDFNGEEEILSSTGITFEADDACGVATITYDPEYITCEQLGETVPVTVTVTDVNGNSNSCVANVLITGLPCGWMDFGDDGIGCVDSNDASYDVPTETFTLESEGCYSNNWTSDNAAYVKYELCGDGEIIAHVASMSPLAGGWAGISARESEAPGSKKVALATNLGNFLRREIRTTTNGYSIPQQFFRPAATWLKITRIGNQFIGSASADGVNWQMVLAVSVPMTPCIQFGLYVTNNNAGTLTATFDHVEIMESSASAFSIPNTDQQGTDAQSFANQDFSIFPNPAKDEIQLDLSDYTGKEVQIEVLNQLGQIIQQRMIPEVGTAPERFNLKGWNGGTYYLRLITQEGQQTKKFLLIE